MTRTTSWDVEPGGAIAGQAGHHVTAGQGHVHGADPHDVPVLVGDEHAVHLGDAGRGTVAISRTAPRSMPTDSIASLPTTSIWPRSSCSPSRPQSSS